MIIRKTILKYLFVILAGALVFYIDSLEFVNSIFTNFLILFLVIFKTAFFIAESIKKILETTRNNISYHHFLGFMAINILLIILSFSVDYLCLYQVDPAAFKGLGNISYTETVFEMIYFSILAFANFGFAEVYPANLFAKIIVTFEIIVYFATIIFILSDFMSLKESIAKRHKEKDKSA